MVVEETLDLSEAKDLAVGTAGQICGWALYVLFELQRVQYTLYRYKIVKNEIVMAHVSNYILISDTDPTSSSCDPSQLPINYGEFNDHISLSLPT